MEEKEINLWYLKEDKESIAQLENIINSAGSWVFSLFIEDPKDVEFRWVEWDILVSVYIKWKFNRYITDEQRREITDYQEDNKTENTIIAEVQPQSFDSDVMVVKVKRWDLE
jgi:nucleoside-specific outer membrane channel protein Tsx